MNSGMPKKKSVKRRKPLGTKMVPKKKKPP